MGEGSKALGAATGEKQLDWTDALQELDEAIGQARVDLGLAKTGGTAAETLEKQKAPPPAQPSPVVPTAVQPAGALKTGEVAAPGPDPLDQMRQELATRTRRIAAEGLANWSFKDLAAKSDEIQIKIDARHDVLEKQGIPFKQQLEDPELAQLYEDRIVYDTAGHQRAYAGAKAILDDVLKGLPAESLYASVESILKERYGLFQSGLFGAYNLNEQAGPAINDPKVIKGVAEDISKLIVARDYPRADYFEAMEHPASALGQQEKERIFKEATKKASDINDRLQKFFLEGTQPGIGEKAAPPQPEAVRPSPTVEISPSAPEWFKAAAAREGPAEVPSTEQAPERVPVVVEPPVSAPAEKPTRPAPARKPSAPTLKFRPRHTDPMGRQVEVVRDLPAGRELVRYEDGYEIEVESGDLTALAKPEAVITQPPLSPAEQAELERLRAENERLKGKPAPAATEPSKALRAYLRGVKNENARYYASQYAAWFNGPRSSPEPVPRGLYPSDVRHIQRDIQRILESNQPEAPASTKGKLIPYRRPDGSIGYKTEPVAPEPPPVAPEPDWSKESLVKVRSGVGGRLGQYLYTSPEGRVVVLNPVEGQGSRSEKWFTRDELIQKGRIETRTTQEERNRLRGREAPKPTQPPVPSSPPKPTEPVTFVFHTLQGVKMGEMTLPGTPKVQPEPSEEPRPRSRTAACRAANRSRRNRTCRNWRGSAGGSAATTRRTFPTN
jgi:hypothetical protein